MNAPILLALRRRGDPMWPDGTVITTAAGRPIYIVRAGRYVRIEEVTA